MSRISALLIAVFLYAMTIATFSFATSHFFAHGIVLDSQTKQPLCNTKVTLISMETGARATVVTTCDGNFQFKLEKNKEYLLYATNGVYSSPPKNIVTKNNEKINRDFNILEIPRPPSNEPENMLTDGIVASDQAIILDTRNTDPITQETAYEYSASKDNKVIKVTDFENNINLRKGHNYYYNVKNETKKAPYTSLPNVTNIISSQPSTIYTAPKTQDTKTFVAPISSIVIEKENEEVADKEEKIAETRVILEPINRQNTLVFEEKNANIIEKAVEIIKETTSVPSPTFEKTITKAIAGETIEEVVTEIITEETIEEVVTETIAEETIEIQNETEELALKEPLNTTLEDHQETEKETIAAVISIEKTEKAAIEEQTEILKDTSLVRIPPVEEVEQVEATSKEKESKDISTKSKEKVTKASDNQSVIENKKQEEMIPKPKKTIVNDIVFKVLIGSFAQPMKVQSDFLEPVLEGLSMDKLPNGHVQYMSGAFSRYSKAIQHQNKLKRNGYSTAKVIVYIENELVDLPIKKALEMANKYRAKKKQKNNVKK